MAFQAPSHLGTEVIEALIIKAMNIACLDKNGDSDITVDEYVTAIFALLPEFLNIKQIVAETRDLTLDEIAAILRTVAANFPDYSGVDNKIEALIRALLGLLSNAAVDIRKVIVAINDLNQRDIQGTKPGQSTKPEAQSENKPTK